MILRMNPVDVSLRLALMPSGMPMMANARQERENDCLEVTAFFSLALSFVGMSGLFAR